MFDIIVISSAVGLMLASGRIALLDSPTQEKPE
jgi:hypothetical protein